MKKRWRELRAIATGLNRLRANQWGDCDRMVWGSLERVVLGVVREHIPRKGRSILSGWMADTVKPSLEEAQRRFNHLAKSYPVRLTIELERTKSGIHARQHFRCHESRPDAAQEVFHLDLLYECLFVSRGYERLGTCCMCGKWFVNEGRNKRKMYCSRTGAGACATRAWPRDRRKKAAILKRVKRKIAASGRTSS